MTVSIENELLTGERILWRANALSGFRIEQYSVGYSVFGAALFAYAAFGFFQALSRYQDQATGHHLIGLIFAGAFSLAGLQLLVGHFIFDRLSRTATEYAVTNRRVIQRFGVFRRTVKSIDYLNVPTLSLCEKPDGSGTVFFGEPKMISAADSGSVAVYIKITAVPDVRSVYELMLTQRAQQVTPEKN